MTLIRPPAHPLRVVFTPEVLANLRARRSPSKSLVERLEIITASGPYPTEEDAAERLRHYRARKAAWDAELSAAFAFGLFEGDRGTDLHARLTNPDDDNFRSAMAECEACWFLGARLRLNVGPSGKGRRGNTLDLSVNLPGLTINIEVKAPACDEWNTHKSEILKNCIDLANRQFDSHESNALCLVPAFQASVFKHREQLIEAFFGRQMISFHVDPRTGSAVDEPRSTFLPDGRFLNRRKPNGKWLKPDGNPGFTRISAVICIEEELRPRCPRLLPGALTSDDKDRYELICEFHRRAQDWRPEPINEVWVDHHALVLHNPHASIRLDPAIWKGLPQFIEQNGRMSWTDGHGLNP